MRILFFVLFLLSYGASIYVFFKVQQSTQKMQKESPVRSFFSSILALCFFFFHLWLLSGFWNLTLLAAFACVLLMSIVVSKILWAVIGPDEEVNYFDQVRYFGVDFGFQSGATILVIMIASNILLIAFPVAMGIAYFSGDYSPDERMQTIIRYAVLINVITGVFTFSPLIFRMLSSKNTNEDVRSIAAIQKVGGTLATAMWVAMALWAFKSEGGGGYAVFAGSPVEFKVSPLLLAIVFVFLALTLFLPYLMGAQRGKKWRMRLLQSRKKIISQMIKALSEPKFAPSDLDAVSDKIDSELAKFYAVNPTLDYWTRVQDRDSGLTLDPDQQTELDSIFRNGRDTDLRFAQIDFFTEMKGEVGEISELLSVQRRKADVDRFIKRYEDMGDEITEEIKAQESFRPQVYAIVFFVASAIISQLFSSFGQWAWSVFAGSPPPAT